jgi:hypothetical protein
MKKAVMAAIAIVSRQEIVAVLEWMNSGFIAATSPATTTATTPTAVAMIVGASELYVSVAFTG